MTTIAYRNGIMAADSRAYAGFNTTLGAKQKIRKLDNGTLVGVSTNMVGLSEIVFDWIESGAKFADAPSINDPKVTVLMVKPNGDVFYMFDSFRFTGPLEAECFAIGSGEGLAKGAMEMGATAFEAIAIAAKHDVWTDLPVHSIARN